MLRPFLLHCFVKELINMQSGILTRSPITLPVIRTISVLAAVSWGWFIVSNVRTQQFGFSLAILGVAAMFVLPVTVVAFIGLRWRTIALGVLCVLLIVMASAEGFAALEEFAFQQKYRALPLDAATVTQERQWPFAHHYLTYDPKSGLWQGGD